MFRFQGLLFVLTLSITSAVSALSIQGRHGTYDVNQFATATIQLKTGFLGWINAFKLTAYAEEPQNHGGSVNNVLNTLSKDSLPYVKLKINSSVKSFASYSLLAKSLRKHRGKLTSPKGEIDQVIAAVQNKGRQSMDTITIYFEKSSDTFFMNLDGTPVSIKSSQSYFSKLLRLFNDTRAKFKIVNLR